MELGGYVRVVRRWWLTILMATLTAGVSGYFVATQLEPSYESTTRMLVGPASTDDFDRIRAAGQLAPTYAELVSSDDVLRTAIQSIPLATTVEEFRQVVRARGNSVTRVLTITVQWGDAATAAAAANGLAGALMEVAAGPPGTSGSLQVLDPASVPVRPIAPQLILIAALAALAGFAGAVLLVLAADYFSDLVRGRADIEGVVDVPLLATVTVRTDWRHELRRLVSELEAAPIPSAYRALAASVFTGAEGSARSLLVAGTDLADGHLEVALSIALAAVQNGQRAVFLHAEPAGLGTTIVREPYKATGLDLLSYRASSHAAPPINERDLTASVMQSGELLIVSGGPVRDSPAVALWASRCDAVILAALRDRTRRLALTDAVNSLRVLGVQPSGVVLAVHRTRVPSLGAWRREDRGNRARDGRRQSGEGIFRQATASDESDLTRAR